MALCKYSPANSLAKQTLPAACNAPSPSRLDMEPGVEPGVEQGVEQGVFCARAATYGPPVLSCPPLHSLPPKPGRPVVVPLFCAIHRLASHRR